MSENFTHRTKPDPVLLEILRCQFQGVVEEMGELLTRCGHTVFVKETQDFIVALVTPQGEVAACSVDVGIWLGVGQNFQAVIDAGGPYRPGDVWMTNDPEQSRGLVTHLLDVFCWRPIYHQGELVCFAAAFIHCTDVGGLAPGSIAPSAVDQLQEGVVIPVTRLVAEDEMREDIFRIFLRNSRIPDKNRGDVLAMLGALKRAELRVTGLAGKFGGDVLRTALHDVLDYAEAQARSLIRDIPDGDYVFWDYLEGDLMPEGRHVRIRLTLRIRGEEMLLDFEGTDPQVAAAFNVPSYSTDGHYLLVMGVVNFMRSVNPDMVYNSGLVRSVKVNAPRGSILNPEPGAPVGARQATFFRVADIVLGALARAWRERMPAAGCGQGSIMLVSAPDFSTGTNLVSIVQPLVGGSGARPFDDGTEGVDFATGFYRNIPTEVLESEIPVLVERYGLNPDSGGAGRMRGGCGLNYSLRLLVPGGVVTARGLERFHFQPWGREAGQPGDNGRAFLQTPGEDPRPIGKINVLEVPAGGIVHVQSAGGGGFGPPWERDPVLVLRDVEDGLVASESAEKVYGVIIRGGRILEDETGERRRQLYAENDGGSPAAPFTFGAGREAFERIWPDDLQVAINRVTEGIPAAIRQHVRFEAMRAVEESRSGADPIDESWLKARVSKIIEGLSPQSTHSA